MNANRQRYRVMWLGKIALTATLVAIVIALVGTTLARYDVIDKLTGFTGFVFALRSALYLAAFAVLALVLGWALARKTSWPALAALLLAGALLYTGNWLRTQAGKYPPIHDVTTDLADPPEFTALRIPADNLRGVENEAEWRRLHAEAYRDLVTARIDATPTEVIERAEQLADDMGWTVIASDPEAGRLEAVAYAGWIRFEDIVVIEAQPVGDGEAAVDMRSVSRVGVSDLGYNAKRIREFLAALEPAD